MFYKFGDFTTGTFDDVKCSLAGQIYVFGITNQIYFKPAISIFYNNTFYYTTNIIYIVL
jgi:hypothetical protein